MKCDCYSCVNGTHYKLDSDLEREPLTLPDKIFGAIGLVLLVALLGDAIRGERRWPR